MNKKIREFAENLVEFINGYDIPIEAKRLVVADVYRRIEEASDKVIAEESNKEESTDAEGTQ